MPHRALLLLSLLSGAAGLIYETVWMRWFRLLFGSTSYAASATLFAFFTGLAIGSAIFARVVGSSRKPPLRLYAVVEVGAALTALGVPLVIELYAPIYAVLYESLFQQRELFVAVKFGLALTAMLPTTILLGGTLPLLSAAFVRESARLGSEGNRLYAVNTVGAAVGTFVAAMWLPERVGVRTTYGLAIALSVAVAIAAWALARHGPGSEPSPLAAPPASAARTKTPPALLAIAFGSGFGTLAAEVVLIHALSLYNLHSVYSFGAILIVVLVALAAGAACVSFAVARWSSRSMLAGALGTTSGLLLTLPFVAQLLKSSLGWTANNPSLAEGFLRAVLLAGPVLFVGGLIFPLTVHLAAGGHAGRRLGALLAANTAGGILGSALASFLLLEHLGLWGSLALLGLVYAAAAAAMGRGARGLALRFAAVATCVCALVLTPLDPWAIPVLEAKEGVHVLALRQGADGIVAVVQHDAGHRQIYQNGIYAFGNSATRPYTERGGHFPLLLHPDPKRVLFVGSASGGTAGAAVLHPVEEIELVELVPAVQELAASYFDSDTRYVHSDPRTRLIVEDGRNHLRAAPGRYDVVVTDQFVPWRAGVGSVYTVEHFRSVREHLSEDGVFVQWLPVFQLGAREFSILARTFAEVFPNASLWRSDFYARLPRVALVGFAGEPIPVDTVRRRVAELAALEIPDPWLTDPQRLWLLYVGPLSKLKAELAGVPLNTDDHPVFEFSAGRSARRDHAPFAAQGWPRLAERVTSRSSSRDPLFPGWPEPGPVGGLALAHIVSLAAAHQPEQANAVVARARPLFPKGLPAFDWTVSDARPQRP